MIVAVGTTGPPARRPVGHPNLLTFARLVRASLMLLRAIIELGQPPPRRTPDTRQQDRPLLAAYCWLVDEFDDDSGARHGLLRHGDLEGEQTARMSAPIRSRQPIHEREMPEASGRARRQMQPVAGIRPRRRRAFGAMPAMESFSSTLTTERTANKFDVSGDQARADMLDFIERF